MVREETPKTELEEIIGATFLDISEDPYKIYRGKFVTVQAVHDTHIRGYYRGINERGQLIFTPVIRGRTVRVGCEIKNIPVWVHDVPTTLNYRSGRNIILFEEGDLKGYELMIEEARKSTELEIIQSD